MLTKAHDEIVLSSVPRVDQRKAQEITSLNAKSARNSCTFLQDLIEIWHVMWCVSTGIVLGILRKYKRILFFRKRSCAATRMAFLKSALQWNEGESHLLMRKCAIDHKLI